MVVIRDVFGDVIGDGGIVAAGNLSDCSLGGNRNRNRCGYTTGSGGDGMLDVDVDVDVDVDRDVDVAGEPAASAGGVNTGPARD